MNERFEDEDGTECSGNSEFAGADRDVPDENIEALVQSAKHGDIATVRDLLAKNVDIEAISESHDRTALVVAAEYGHCEIVEILLKSGANVNAQCDGDLSALYLASVEGHHEIVDILQIGRASCRERV